MLIEPPFSGCTSSPIIDDADGFVLMETHRNAVSDPVEESKVCTTIRKVLAALLTNSVFQNLKNDEAASITVKSIPLKAGEKREPLEANFTLVMNKGNFLQTIRNFLSALMTNQIFQLLNFDLIAVSVTAMSAVKTTCLPKRLPQVIPDTTNIPEEYRRSIDKIVNTPWVRLPHGELAHFIEYLMKTYPNRFDFIDAGYGYPVLGVDERKPLELVQNKLRLYEQRSEHFTKRDLLFIPFGYPGHIVCLAVDFVNKTVEYYDSQGHLSDSWRRQVYPGFNMREQLEEIKKLCFGSDPAAKILENTVQHQWDSNNCVVYVCDFMERRIKHEDFDAISKSGKSSAEILVARDMLAIKLISLSSAML